MGRSTGGWGGGGGCVGGGRKGGKGRKREHVKREREIIKIIIIIIIKGAEKILENNLCIEMQRIVKHDGTSNNWSHRNGKN